MLYPRLFFAFVLCSLLVILPCGSTGQRKRSKYSTNHPTLTTTGDCLTLTSRLKKMRLQTLYITRHYTIFTRPQQFQSYLPTGYRQPNLHELPSQLNPRGYASSIQLPNPPPLALASGNQPDIAGRNIPDNPNTVEVEEQQVGKRIRLVYRTMCFPQFTNIDDFNQTVLKMNLPGEPLAHDMIHKDLKAYQEMLTQNRFLYTALSVSDTPNSSVMVSVDAVRSRLSRIGSIKRACGRFTFLEKNSREVYKSSTVIPKALHNAEAIVIIYCKKSDVNTYFEVMWYPDHPSYSVERILAYLMRRYEGITTIMIKTDGDYAGFLKFMTGAVASPSADICSKCMSDPLTLSST